MNEVFLVCLWVTTFSELISSRLVNSVGLLPCDLVTILKMELSARAQEPLSDGPFIEHLDPDALYFRNIDAVFHVTHWNNWAPALFYILLL